MVTISKAVVALFCAGSFVIGSAATFVVVHKSEPSCAPTSSADQFFNGKVERKGSQSF
jgi:hypothetical protein